MSIKIDMSLLTHSKLKVSEHMTTDLYKKAIDTETECRALIEYLNGRKKELGRIKAKIVSDMDTLGIDQLRKYGAKFTAFDNDGRRLIKIDLPQVKEKITEVKTA